jgi:carboxymethylenebutenolidase
LARDRPRRHWSPFHRAFSVASVNYGGLTSNSERALPRACPIVASYGAKDRWRGISKVPGLLEPVLTTACIDHDIKVYSDAGHGFLNDHDPDDLTRLDKVIAKLTATRSAFPWFESYQAASASL